VPAFGEELDVGDELQALGRDCDSASSRNALCLPIMLDPSLISSRRSFFARGGKVSVISFSEKMLE